MDNVEERQNRIQEEQKGGGAETAYNIAVSHMLKPHVDNASAKERKSTSIGADAVDSATEPRKTLEHPPEDARADARTGRPEPDVVMEETVGENNVIVNEGGIVDKNLGLKEKKEAVEEETSGAISDEGDGSDYYSGSDSEATGDEGRTRRSWSERRARLRKDGMHGRRLPPPEAQEQRATAKADKREVRRHWWE